MSRAFTKEIDDAPEPPPLERPISAAPNLVTPAGAAQITQTLASLEAQLAVNPDPSLKRDQRYWAARHATMQVLTPDAHPTSVGFGTFVTIKRAGKRIELQIVGEDEADPSQNRIAWTAPLAKALDGAEPGETVELDAVGRVHPIEIIGLRGA